MSVDIMDRLLNKIKIFVRYHGVQWRLHGWYGKQVEALIQEGICTPSHPAGRQF
jgi:hypothetical protein